MHAETIAAEIQAPLRRPRLLVAANDAATFAAACAILGHSAIIADTAADADWVVPLADGDALTADGVAALAALGHGADAPALIVFAAVRRVDGAEIPMPRFDVRDPAYALAASAGFSLAAMVWRADVWAELQGPGAASYAPRFAATRLVETGARICAEPTVLIACTARPFAEPARGALQNALAITAAISLDGAERRWPQAMLMTMAEMCGAAIGAGLYGPEMLEGAAALPNAPIDDSELAYRFLEGLCAGASAPLDGLAASRETLRADIEHFFDEIAAIGAPERQSDAARWRVLYALFRGAAQARTLAVTPIDIDLSKPLAPIKGVGPRTLLARVHHEGRDLDWIQLPTIDGAAASDLRLVLRDALERQATWRIGQLAGVRKGADFYRSLAVEAVRAAPDAAIAAAKGEAGHTALARLRSRIVRDAQISRIPALRAKRGKGRQRPERPALPPIGATTRLPVLMYHEVVAVDAEASRFATTIEAFEAQLRWLAEAGYQSIGAAEWANAVRAGRPIPEKSVLITFDDAYVDFADLAWPALRRNGFSAALFAPALYVGKSPAWRGAPKGQRLLDYTTLRGLSDDGCEIGSHAMSHRHLTSLGPEDMLEEAFESKKILEDMIGQEVNVVAYPFGDSDTAVRSAFRIAGFRGGFCAWGCASTLDDDPMNIARIEVRGDMSLDAFAAHVTGHSAAVTSLWAS
ncbi:MAG: polysaccharide deacetylase family protein [Caulobacterales bacterium]